MAAAPVAAQESNPAPPPATTESPATKAPADSQAPQRGASPRPAKPAAPAKADAGQSIDKITVEGAKDNDTEDRRQSTAAKLVFSRDEIARYGDSTVGEVLRRLPGVTVDGRSGRGGQIRMRGLGSGYTQILINGEPSPPGFSIDSLSPDLIERIEVIRAPVAEYSAQAIAGTINIVLREDPRKQQSEVKVGAEHQNGKLNYGLQLQHGDKIGAIAYTLVGGVRKDDNKDRSVSERRGYSPTGALTLVEKQQGHTETDNSGIHLSPRLTWRIGDGNTLTLQSFITHNDSSGKTRTDVDRILGAYAPFAHSDSTFDNRFTAGRLNANWQRKLAEGAKLEMRAGVGSFRFNTSSRTLENDDAYRLLRTVDNSNKIRDRSLSTGGKYSQPIGDGHSLAVGWDAEFSNRHEDRETLENGRPLYAEYGTALEARTRRIAVFAQDEWEINPQWSAYGGLRWESVRTTSDSDAFASVNNTSSVWSPTLHGVWRIPGSRKDQIRASLTRSYRAPRTADLIARPQRSELNSPTSPDRAGNPDLKPELAWGLEFAFEHYLKEGGLLSANVFTRRIDNLMRRRTVLVGDRWLSQPQNFGEASTSGIELEAKFRLRELMADAPPVDFRFNYSRYWSRVDGVPGPDNRLDEQTPQTANIGIDYRMTQLPLTLGGSYNWAPSYAVRVSETETRQNPSRRTLDLYALWKFTPSVQLRLSGFNLLQPDHVSSSSVVQRNFNQTQSSFNETYLRWRAMLEVKF